MRSTLVAGILAILFSVPSSSDDPKAPLKTKRKPDALMTAKLKEAQAVLEGLALHKPEQVQTSAEELLRISKEAQFRRAVPTPQYEYFANAFQKSAEALIDKAKARSIDGATLAYVDMTLTCVKCHHHTREQGLGRATPSLPGGLGR